MLQNLTTHGRHVRVNQTKVRPQTEPQIINN
jgi:hypothetical protein